MQFNSIYLRTKNLKLQLIEKKDNEYKNHYKFFNFLNNIHFINQLKTYIIQLNNILGNVIFDFDLNPKL